MAAAMVAHNRLPSLETVPPSRRSFTAAALRRGEIKISEPVPLENSGPSPVWKSAHSVNGFPSPGFQLNGPHNSRPSDSVTGFGTSMEQFPMPAPESAPPSSAPPKTSSFTEQGLGKAAEFPSSGSGEAIGSSQQKHHTHRRTATFMSVSREALAQEQQMMAQGSHARRPSMNDDFANSPLKKKRRSGSIRMAFRRMFSKKEKEASEQDSPQRGPSIRGVNDTKQEYHNSDSAPAVPRTSLSALNEDKEEAFQGQELPQDHKDLTDDYRESPTFIPPRLPFPMNVHAPQSPQPSPPRENYTSFETSPLVHKRRATVSTGSAIISATDAATLNKYWKSDNGASTPDIRDLMRTPTPLIGLAITSGSGSNPNRRSRSADALRDMAQTQMFQETRRRSAEIQYWRDTKQGIPEHDEVEGEDMEKASIKEGSSEDASPEEESEEPDFPILHHESPERTVKHAKSVDIASLKSSSKASSERQLERQRIDDSTPIDRVDVRLSQLEFNMEQLNRTMQKISEPKQEAQPQPFRLKEAPRGHKNRESRLPGLPSSPRDTRNAFPSRSFSMRNYPSNPTLRPSTSAAALPIPKEEMDAANGTPNLPAGFTAEEYQAPNPVHNFSLHIPSAPHPSSSFGQQYSPDLLDHLAPLYNALRYERSARKVLEDRVLQLQHDLLGLTTVVAQLRGLSTYPTPSPDNMPKLGRHSVPVDDAEDLSEGDERRFVGGAVQEEFGTPSRQSDWNGDMF